MLDRNSPVTPLGRMCSNHIANALLIPSGQTHKLTEINHWGVIPNLPRVFCIEIYNYVPLEVIKDALKEEAPAFVYQHLEQTLNPSYYDTVLRPSNIG